MRIMDEINIKSDFASIDFGFFILNAGYEIKIYKNYMMQNHSAMLSPELFDKLFEHFQKMMLNGQEDERSVATGDAQ